MARAIIWVEFIVVTLFSCAYLVQLFSIAKNYFEYAISSQVEILSPEKNYSHLPALTLCSKGFLRARNGIRLPKSSEFPREKTQVPYCKLDKDRKIQCLYKFLTHPHPDGHNEQKVILSTNQFEYQVYNNTSLLAYFFKNSIQPHTLIENLTIQNNQLMNKMYYERFYWKSMFCYTINNEGIPIEYSGKKQELIKITLNASSIDSLNSRSPLMFFVSKEGFKFYSFDRLGSSILSNLKNNMSLTISHGKYVMNSLEAPYKSRCVRYSEFNVNSRDECISKCSRSFYNFLGVPSYDLFDQRSGILAFCPSEDFIDKCFEYLYQSGDYFFAKRTFIQMSLAFAMSTNLFEKDAFKFTDTHYCQGLISFINCTRILCRAMDCEQTIYSANKENLASSEQGITISLLLPQNFVTHVQLIPGSHLMEFILATFSAAAFWYGFDVLNVCKFTSAKVELFVQMLKKVKQAKMKSKITSEKKLKTLVREKFNELKKQIKSETLFITKMKVLLSNDDATRKLLKSGGEKVCAIPVEVMVLFLCLTGALLQIYTWTRWYMMYNVQNEVQIEFEEFIKVPYIHLCCRASQMYNVSATKGGKLVKVGSFLNKTPDEILDDTTDFYNYVEILDWANHPFYNSHLIEFKYLRQGYLCYIVNVYPFNSQSKIHRLSLATLKVNKINNEYAGTVALVPVDISANEVSSFRVYLSQRKHVIQGTDETFAFVNRKIEYTPYSAGDLSYFARQTEIPASILKSNVAIVLNGAFTTDQVTMQIDYYITSQKLLEKPFITDCFNYTSIGMSSRGQCYETCLNKLTLSALGLSPSEISFLNGKKNLAKMYKYPFYRHFIQVCRDKCRRAECMTKSFKPVLTNTDAYVISSYRSSINASFNSIFSIAISDKPNIHFTASPQVTLTFLITFDLSCLCFWFNWAPIPLTLQFIKIFEKKNSKKKKKHKKDKNSNSIIAQVQLVACKFDGKVKSLTDLLLQIRQQRVKQQQQQQKEQMHN